MPNPVEQFVTLAKANLDLTLRLAEIARGGGQQSVDVGNRAIARLAEEAHAVTASAGDKGRAEAKGPESPKGGLQALSEIEAIRGRMVSEAQAAFEEWQRAWTSVVIVPAISAGPAAFATLLTPQSPSKPGEGAAEEPAKSAGQVPGQTPSRARQI